MTTWVPRLIPDLDLASQVLDADERSLLAQVDGASDNHAVVRRAGLYQRQGQRLLFSLLVRGVISQVGGDPDAGAPGAIPAAATGQQLGRADVEFENDVPTVPIKLKPATAAADAGASEFDDAPYEDTGPTHEMTLPPPSAAPQPQGELRSDLLSDAALAFDDASTIAAQAAPTTAGDTTPMATASGGEDFSEAPTQRVEVKTAAAARRRSR